MKFGWLIYRRDSNRIPRIFFDILIKEHGKFVSKFEFSFSGSFDEKEWYSNVSAHTSNDLMWGDIDLIRSIIKRYHKHNPVISNPYDFIDWLDSLHGCVGRLIYDNREGKYIPVNKIKSNDYFCYMAIRQHKYPNISSVLARDEKEAKKLLLLKLSSNDRYVEEWLNNNREVKKLSESAPVVLNINEVIRL